MTERILQICHNHPALHAGGTEIFAYDLFRELNGRPGVEATFLACTDDLHRKPRPGTVFQTIGDTGDEFLMWSGHFDRFFLSQIDLHGLVPEFADMLQSLRPDVVHFHHFLLLGVETLFLVRQLLPDARIVVTLHDYFPICPNEGLMVRQPSQALCRAASTDACGRCFPTVAADQFLLRRKLIMQHFSLVDCFVAPSAFLRQRYSDWGLDERRIVQIPNGQPPIDAPPTASAGRRRDRFGFFGNLTPFKGIDLALDAAALLIKDDGQPFGLQVFGDAMYQSEAFQVKLEQKFTETAPAVRRFGAYDRADLSRLMARVDWVIVPSIWWENAPLVIQEAFLHGRPVICSDIGGMAEMVRDGVDGLHFAAGDFSALAATMQRAMDEPALWGDLSANLPTVPGISQSTDRYLALYRDGNDATTAMVATA